MEVELTGPPQMEGVGYGVLSATSILITWTTDRPASSQVRYGTGDVLDCETAVDTTAVLEHSVVVWPVAPRIPYTFVAVSACGCDTTTCEPMLFSALPPQGQNSQVVPIEVIKVDIEPQDSSAIVLWATDRPCSSWVELGKSTQCETAVPGVPLGEAVYTATVEGLAPGTTYHLRVSTWDVAFGESEGDDLIFSTEFPNDGQPPAPPTGITCHQAEGGVEVTWDPNTEPDLLGYNLYRARYRDDGIDWSRAVMLTSTPTPDVRYFDRSVEEGASYEYAASAVDRSGNESGYSTSAAVTVESAAAGLAFGAYPNPMRCEAHLTFALPPGIGEGRVRIVSLSGRIVMETDVSASSARSAEQIVTWNGRDRGGWPVADGVYMCELVAGGQVARRKLTVLR
jgi:hypothetical protein